MTTPPKIETPEEARQSKADGRILVRRKNKGRPYYAGKVIGEYGLDQGVTPEMIARLNKLVGKVNDAESTFALKFAWHVVRAYEERYERN